ncbi:MAG: hypothetical protein ACQEVA_20875 [Myxococcota bacterium]
MLRRVVLSLFLLSTALFLGCGPDDGVGTAGAVQITYPEEGEFIGSSAVEVRGTVTDANTVTVNGQDAEVIGEEWSVRLDFPDGPTTVEAVTGENSDTVDFVVDTTPPTLELTAPARGLFITEEDGPAVQFTGTVSDDGSGLKLLKRDNVAVDYDDQGAFEHTFTADQGYNQTTLTAIDRAGNEATVMRGMIYGPMTDATSEIEDAVELLASPDAIDTATTVVEQLMTPERITEFATDAFQNDNIALTSIDYDTLDVQATPRPSDPDHDTGYIDMEVYVENFVIEGTASLGGGDYPTTITVAEATLTTEITLEANEQGGLGITLGNTTLDLADEDLSFTVESENGGQLSDDDVQILRDVAAGAVRTALAELLSDRLIDLLYDPGILRRKIEILGRTLEFQLYVRDTRISSDGVYVNTSLQLLSDRFEDVPEAPGALNLPLGLEQPPTIEGDILATSHENAVNRILHGVWRSGLLHQELSGSDFAGVDLPFELKASALSAIVDSRIADLEGPDAPAVLTLRPMLPPVVNLAETEDGNSLAVDLGELLVDIAVVPSDGGEPTRVGTIAIFLDITATVVPQDGQLGLELEAVAEADLDAEPAFDMDDQAVEDALVRLMELALEVVGDDLQLGAETELLWLTITNPQTQVHGEEGDQLSITVDVEPNPGAIE